MTSVSYIDQEEPKLMLIVYPDDPTNHPMMMMRHFIRNSRYGTCLSGLMRPRHDYYPIMLWWQYAEPIEQDQRCSTMFLDKPRHPNPRLNYMCDNGFTLFECICDFIDATPSKFVHPTFEGQSSLPKIGYGEWEGLQKQNTDIQRVLEWKKVNKRPGSVANETENVKLVMRQ